MRDYVVRSTYTHAESAARRAADVIIMLLLCALILFVLFRFMYVPVAARDPQVRDIADGELLIIDRVSKYLVEYSPGDIVRADVGGGMNAYRVAAAGECEALVRNGRLYINGGLLDESGYATSFDEGVELSCSVPYNCVLLLPDDRSGVDSLEGFVLPVGEIFGKLRLRIYPFNRIGLFG